MRHPIATVMLAGLLAGCGSSEAAQSFDWAEAPTEVVGELAYGQTHVGPLEAGVISVLTFRAEAGDVASAFITAVPRSGDLAPTLLLWGPDAEPRVVASGDDGRVQMPAELVNESGTYFVGVAGQGAAGQGGDYRLRLTCEGGPCARPWIEAFAPACGLSELGHAVHNAALAADQSRNTVPPARMVSYTNRAAPPLITGPVMFPAMADAIALAEAEVDVAMFVFSASDPYEEIIDALARLEARRIAEAADQPVVVRIVVDAQKAVFNTGGTVVQGVVDGIAPLGLDPNYVQVLFATYEHLTLGNLHTKMVIVDGKTVMLGGANIQDQHDYADPWMDSFYALEGEAAGSFLFDFDEAWNEADKWHCESKCEKWSDAPPSWHPATVLDPDLGLDPEACVPTIALNRTAWGGFNNDVDNPMDQGLLAAFDGARRRIRIQTPNLNDDAVKDAIIRALARGVDVQLILSLGFNDTAMNFFGGTNEETVAWLAEHAGAHAHRLEVRWYSADGTEPIDGNVPGASHLKYFSVDGQLVVVGSTNMDTIAWNHSRETNVAVDSAVVTAAWDAAAFEPNWRRSIQ